MTAPLMSEVIRNAIEYRLDSIYTATPAVVHAYSASDQRVSVQPAIKVAYLDEEGDQQVETMPIVTDVPVAFFGSGIWRFSCPITKGDTGMLIFSQSSLDVWLSRGGVADPGDYRKFDLSDGMFIPGLRPFNAALGDAPTDSMVMGVDGGVGVKVTETEVQAGGTSALATKQDVQDVVDAITNGVPVATDGGAALQTSIVAGLAGVPAGTTVLKGS